MAEKNLNLGIQPLDGLMEELELKNHDLVEGSKDGLTHKQIQKGRKGRRLSRNVQEKIISALLVVTGNRYARNDLFTYD